jgi:hypothetical protein
LTYILVEKKLWPSHKIFLGSATDCIIDARDRSSNLSHPIYPSYMVEFLTNRLPKKNKNRSTRHLHQMSLTNGNSCKRFWEILSAEFSRGCFSKRVLVENHTPLDPLFIRDSLLFKFIKVNYFL